MNSLSHRASPATAGGDVPRAERLLAAMHKVFSHDLRNQLVVVQSLISLLELEETPHLTQDGKEHLTRLKGAAARAGVMVDFLKEMARLARASEASEDIRLTALAREIKGELSHLYAD